MNAEKCIFDVSQEMDPSLLSFKIILEVLQSEPIRFKFLKVENPKDPGIQPKNDFRNFLIKFKI